MSPGLPNSDADSSTSTTPDSSNALDLDAITDTKSGKDNYNSPKTKVFDGERWRERTRTTLAIALLVNIVLTQFSVICYLFAPTVLSLFGKDKSDNNDLSKNLVKLSDSTSVYVVNSEKEDKNKDSRELITLIWTSQITLASGALGFYFAANKEKSE